MVLQTSSLIERDLIRDEGVRDRPYLDTTGHSTIGVGHNLTSSGLCEEAILAQLRHDISLCEIALDGRLPWWRSHPEPVRRALVNLTFNLGIAGLTKFTRTLTAIREARYADAAAALLASKYATQVGARAKRLAALLEV